MGNESQALEREARKAWRPSAAASAGMAVPFSAFSLVQAMTRLLLGQMMPRR